MGDTTRIQDLPNSESTSFPQMNSHGGSGGSGGSGRGMELGGNNTGYIALNVHSNPYGNTDPQQNSMMPPQQDYNDLYQQPQQQQPQQQQPQHQQPQQQQPQQQHRIPSRDFANSTIDLTQDIEARPNYVPSSKLTQDYIQRYEDEELIEIKKHQKKQKSVRFKDDLSVLLQTPILLSFLFFLFQLPIITRIMYKYLSFIPIFTIDGNLNIIGMACKSISFGSIFFFITSICNS
jgi:hypothetical protein